MNELDWIVGADPEGMLAYLDGKTTDRKLRLAACAFVRHRWSLIHYPMPRAAVELAERLAEGRAAAADVEEMRQNAAQWAYNAPMFEQPTYQAIGAALAESASEAARLACDFIRQQAVREAAYELIPGQDEARINAEAADAERRQLGQLLHEIFGNPFRPARVEPAWLRGSDGAATALARWIDEEHRLEELPYLADALTDAGCDDDAMIRHLRQPGHLRGCWVLDLVLGR